MADLGEVNGISGVFGGIEVGGFGTQGNTGTVGQTGGNFSTQENAGTVGQTVGDFPTQENVGTIRQAGSNLPTKVGFWNKFKTFWLQDIDWNKEIKVELTPNQQKVEDEINEFLHQDITWKKVRNFLFQEVSFRSKNNK